MKKSNNLGIGIAIISLFFCHQTFSQNMETMYIEKMENVSMVFPAECTPEDLVIIINSSLQDLKFESNMLPSDEFTVIHNEIENQYIICHEKIKFKLTVSGTNLQSEDIDIFDLEKPLAYRISANIAKGKVNILTNPRNSTVIFPGLNNLVLSSNQPITNVSGKYKVNIVKAQYKNVDTTIVIPRDAEKTYNIDLIPLFSMIKLDLRADDNSTFQKAPTLWIDSTKIELDALIKPGTNLRSFFDDVEFNKFYEGNIIPVIEGNHKLKIEAESYVPFEKTIQVKNGKIFNLSVSLEPIFGYLTLVDKQFAEGASAYVDDQKIGQVPLFKLKTRVGLHKIRFEKAGYIPMSEDNSVVIEEKKVTDFDVSMFVARKISFETNPPYAEVIMDNNRIGFTPVTTIVNAGTHELLIRKSGFATEKISKRIDVNTTDEETEKIDLRPVIPIYLESEKEGLLVDIEGKEQNKSIEIEEKYITPTNIPLPYGKYLILLSDEKRVLYKGTINHKPEILKRGKLPIYSKSTFHLLDGSIGINQKTGNLFGVKEFSDIDNFEASFGRIQVFPGTGLSSALINVDYKLISTDSIDYKALAPNIFFLNWDWRLGGSIIRQIDFNFLGRAKYTPGLKLVKTNIPGFADVEMQNYFYGFEISTRLSYININFRFGRQINIGKLNYWKENDKTYLKNGIPLSRNDEWMGSIGITLNGKVYRSNNMLRVWNNPLFDPAKKKEGKSKTTKNTKSRLFNGLKFGKQKEKVQ